MPNYVEIPPEGFSGGIWLLWKHSIYFNLQIISTNIRFIHCQITNNIDKVSWFGNFIFGFPHQHLQKHLWKQISIIPDTDIEPWLILGDLNELTNSNEKSSITQGNSTWYTRFNNFLQSKILSI